MGKGKNIYILKKCLGAQCWRLVALTTLGTGGVVRLAIEFLGHIVVGLVVLAQVDHDAHLVAVTGNSLMYMSLRV